MVEIEEQQELMKDHKRKVFIIELPTYGISL